MSPYIPVYIASLYMHSLKLHRLLFHVRQTHEKTFPEKSVETICILPKKMCTLLLKKTGSTTVHQSLMLLLYIYTRAHACTLVPYGRWFLWQIPWEHYVARRRCVSVHATRVNLKLTVRSFGIDYIRD